MEYLLVFNKILNSLKITDQSPYFLCFQNDTEVMFDFNSSPNEERICGQTTQLVANSDIPPQRGRLGGVQPLGKTLLIGATNCTLQSIPPQRGRLGGVQHGGCKNNPRQASSFNTILESPFRGVLVVTKLTCSYDQCTPTKGLKKGGLKKGGLKKGGLKKC